jgi:hypothetical protein
VSPTTLLVTRLLEGFTCGGGPVPPSLRIYLGSCPLDSSAFHQLTVCATSVASDCR